MCKHKGLTDEKFNSTLFKTTSSTIRKFGQFTDNEWRRLAQKAEATNEPQYGIKGSCQLMKLDYVDMAIIAPPESLHFAYLGELCNI